MSYKSNYTGEQIDKVIGDNLEVSIKDLKRELDDAKDVVVYQIPSDFIPSNGEEVIKEITTDVFQSIFGNIDEFINNVKTKHIRLGIPYVYEEVNFTETTVDYIDVTSSLSVKISPTGEEVIDVIGIHGSISLELGENDTISVEMIIMCNSTDVMGSWTAKKETTPEEIKYELEEKIKTIIYNWDDLDLSVKEGTVSQEVYDNLLKADVVTNNGAVFNSKCVEGSSIILTLQCLVDGGEGLVGCDLSLVKVYKDLNYTVEMFGYNLISEDLVDEKINNSIYSVLNTEV